MTTYNPVSFQSRTFWRRLPFEVNRIENWTDTTQYQNINYQIIPVNSQITEHYFNQTVPLKPNNWPLFSVEIYHHRSWTTGSR